MVGKFYGISINKPHLLSNKISTFTAVTFFGCPKFLCKMLSVRERDSKFIFQQTNLVLDTIKIVAIVYDGIQVKQDSLKDFIQKDLGLPTIACFFCLIMFI